MRIMNLTLFLAMVAVWAGATRAQTPDVFEQNKRLGRGVNAIGYDAIWKDRAKGRFKDEHFKLLAEAGFNHVRINLHPFRDVKLDTSHKLPDAYLQTLDWAVDTALANKLMVILDFHEFKTMSADPPAHKERYLAIWKQLAERYKDRPASVVFELLNEPHGKFTAELWNEYLKEALAVIRATNPTRTVIVGPIAWNGIKALDTLKLPESDRNLIVTVHYYSPFPFTHQGAPWANLKDKTGVAWNDTPAERQAIQKDFDKAQAWSKKENRPLYLGEFGAYDKAEMSSRVRWTSAVAREAEARGWSWGYWQFDSDFILYDIKNSTWVTPIRDALVPPPGK